jgi:peptidoglycan hydrolase-like protein with peptidoglycan-binding domain
MKLRQMAIGYALSVLMVVPVFAQAATDSQMGGQSSSGMQSMSNNTRTGSPIKTVQNKLIDKGYNVGKVDGIWGSRSAAALKKYQQANGLQATGQLDQQTADTLGLESGEFAAFEAAVG